MDIEEHVIDFYTFYVTLFIIVITTFEFGWTLNGTSCFTYESENYF